MFTFLTHMAGHFTASWPRLDRRDQERLEAYRPTGLLDWRH